jgi:hypothetical protein
MHKYIPRIHIVEEGKSLSTFNFNETSFTAVTAYQNERVSLALGLIFNEFFILCCFFIIRLRN